MRATARPDRRPGGARRALAPLLAGFAALALSAAGPQGVRAEEPSASAGEGRMCRAESPERARARAEALQRIRRRILEARAEARADTRDREGVVLDGRGLRYRAARDVMRELDRVRADARRP